MSSGVGATARRIFALARATVRERFLAGTLLLALAFAACWWLAERDLASVLPDWTAGLEFERRFTLLAWVASGAALLAGAHVLGADRRTQQLDAWRAAPLRMGELLLGRVGGAAVRVACGALPLFVWIIVFDPAGLCRQREFLAPRPQFEPNVVERQLADGSRRRWRRGPAVLDPGEQLRIEFAGIPDGANELLFQWRAALAEDAAPVQFTLHVDGREVVRAAGGDLARLAITLEPAATHRLQLAVAADSGVVRVELPEVVVRGAVGSLQPTIARLALGLFAEIALATAVGAALAVFVTEGLAIIGGALLLLLCNLKALLLDAAAAIDDSHLHFDESLLAIARGYEWLVAWLPDATALRGAERAARAMAPWDTDSTASLVGAGIVALIALLAAGAVLARRPRGAR